MLHWVIHFKRKSNRRETLYPGGEIPVRHFHTARYFLTAGDICDKKMKLKLPPKMNYTLPEGIEVCRICVEEERDSF